MKTYHDTQTGKFVSKERVKSDPAGTVKITSVDLRQELCDFFKFFRDNGEENIGMTIEQFVDEYIKQR